MSSIKTSKEILRKWCEMNLSTHTDWSSTRIETINKCDSVEEFVDRLYQYLEDNSWKV